MFKNSTTEERRLRREAKAKDVIAKIRAIKWSTRKPELSDRVSAKERRSRLLARRDSDLHSMVYFVYSAGRIKIGQTGDGDRRAGGLTNGMPMTPWVIYVRPGGKVTEYALHCRFEDYRLHGEWFEFSPAIREFVMEYGGRSALNLLREAESDHVLWITGEAKRLGIVTVELPSNRKVVYNQ